MCQALHQDNSCSLAGPSLRAESESGKLLGWTLLLWPPCVQKAWPEKGAHEAGLPKGWPTHPFTHQTALIRMPLHRNVHFPS